MSKQQKKKKATYSEVLFKLAKYYIQQGGKAI